MKKQHRRLTAMAVVVLSILALSAPLIAAEKIEIAMGYIPNVQFSPYYIAQEMGFFQEEDLEVSFDYGMSTDIMTLVAGGHVDFGISDGDQVIIARDRGIPVKVVYTMYVKYPVGIVSFQEKGLTIVPLRMYMKGNCAKVEIALARGKKLYDKRAAMDKRETQRRIEREIKSQQR